MIVPDPSRRIVNYHQPQYALLLHADAIMPGGSGSDYFIDNSGHGHTIGKDGGWNNKPPGYGGGQVILEEGDSKFGDGCFAFYPGPSRIYWPTSDVFDFGDGNWTFDFWAKILPAPGERLWTIHLTIYYYNFDLELTIGGGGQDHPDEHRITINYSYFLTMGRFYRKIAYFTPEYDVWRHYAFVYSENDGCTRAYIDGAIVSYYYMGGNLFGNVENYYRYPWWNKHPINELYVYSNAGIILVDEVHLEAKACFPYSFTPPEEPYP